MATAKTARQLAEERAEKSGKKVASFAAAGKGAIRNIHLQVIDKGTVITIPTDYQVFEQEIRGSKAAYLVSEEGISFYPSVLTRGAKPAAGGDYVVPKGTVVDACQDESDMDKFVQEKLAGKKIKFTDKVTVEAVASWAPEGVAKINVWTIDFVA